MLSNPDLLMEAKSNCGIWTEWSIELKQFFETAYNILQKLENKVMKDLNSKLNSLDVSHALCLKKLESCQEVSTPKSRLSLLLQRLTPVFVYRM